jgi:hypothetical protein
MQVGVLGTVMKTHMKLWRVPRKKLIDLHKVTFADDRIEGAAQERKEVG